MEGGPVLPCEAGGHRDDDDLERNVERDPPYVLVSKVLTYSDVSTDVARTGRVVLPRLQVQQHLGLLLALGGAEHALDSCKPGAPLRVSVDLVVWDSCGMRWVITLKTWQNVVSGEHRPTFVLENTAGLVKARKLHQGCSLALCAQGGRLMVRTDLAVALGASGGRKDGAVAGLGGARFAAEGVFAEGATCQRTPGCRKSAGHKGFCTGHQGFTKKAEGPRTPVVASALVGSGRKRKRSVRAPPQLRRMQLPRTYNPLQLPSSSAAGGAEGAAPQEMTAYEQSDGFWGAEASLGDATQAAQDLMLLLELEKPSPFPSFSLPQLPGPISAAASAAAAAATAAAEDPLACSEQLAADSANSTPGRMGKGIQVETYTEGPGPGSLSHCALRPSSSSPAAASPWGQAQQQRQRRQQQQRQRRQQQQRQRRQQQQPAERGAPSEGASGWPAKAQTVELGAIVALRAGGTLVRPRPQAGAVRVGRDGSLCCVQQGTLARALAQGPEPEPGQGALSCPLGAAAGMPEAAQHDSALSPILGSIVKEALPPGLLGSSLPHPAAGATAAAAEAFPSAAGLLALLGCQQKGGPAAAFDPTTLCGQLQLPRTVGAGNSFRGSELAGRAGPWASWPPALPRPALPSAAAAAAAAAASAVATAAGHPAALHVPDASSVAIRMAGWPETTQAAPQPPPQQQQQQGTSLGSNLGSPLAGGGAGTPVIMVRTASSVKLEPSPAPPAAQPPQPPPILRPRLPSLPPLALLDHCAAAASWPRGGAAAAAAAEPPPGSAQGLAGVFSGQFMTGPRNPPQAAAAAAAEAVASAPAWLQELLLLQLRSAAAGGLGSGRTLKF